MTRGVGPDGNLPVFDAIESPPGVRHGGSGRASGPGPGPARGTGVALAVLLLLVAGIVVGGLSLNADPSASPDSPPDPSGLLDPSGSPAEACRSPREGGVPPVALGLAGSSRGVNGLFSFGTGGGQSTDPPDWLVPPTRSALPAAPGAQLVIGSELDLVVGSNSRISTADTTHACFRHLTLTYRPTRKQANDDGASLFDAALIPATGRVVVAGLPAGDWIIRVTAAFETFGTLPAELITVSYFRVLSGDGPFVTDAATPSPARTPLVSPAVPCGTLLPTPDVGVSLFVGPDVSVTGAIGPDAVPAEAHARIGDQIRMIVDGEICAVSWSIELSDPTRSAAYHEEISNDGEDPAYVAQNRWELPIAGRNGILTAVLHFVGGLDITRTWQFVTDPFDAPHLVLVGPDGTRFEASAGCGLSLDLSNGYQASDGCGSVGYQPSSQALQVSAYQPIYLDLTGWQISNWGVVCGRVTADPAPQFESPDGCALGGASSDDGTPLLDPAAFLIPPGDTILQINIGAVDGAGNRFSVPYYAHVVAR